MNDREDIYHIIDIICKCNMMAYNQIELAVVCIQRYVYGLALVGHANVVVGFDHGLPWRVKNMARGTQ